MALLEREEKTLETLSAKGDLAKENLPFFFRGRFKVAFHAIFARNFNWFFPPAAHFQL